MSELNPYEGPNTQAAATAGPSRTASRAPFARAFFLAGSFVLFVTILGGGVGALGGYILHRTSPELFETKVDLEAVPGLEGIAHGQPFGLFLGLVSGTIAVVVWNWRRRRADIPGASSPNLPGWPELIAGFGAVLLATLVGGAVGAANGRILAEVRRLASWDSYYADPAYASGAGAAEGLILACVAGLVLLASVYSRAKSNPGNETLDAGRSSDRGSSAIGHAATVVCATIVGTTLGAAIGWLVGEASRKFAVFPFQSAGELLLEYVLTGIVLGTLVGIFAGSVLAAIFALHRRRSSRRQRERPS